MANYPVEVSIVVPVYNSEKHLRTCIDSLLCQTVESYEIVCVNNGSTDSSGEILKEYAEKFPDKFFVYDIEHSNFVGTGRNYGISKARGKYIYLCDSDDIIEKNGVLFLYNRMNHYNLDVCYGQVNFVNLQSNTSFTLKSDGEREVSVSELIQSGAEFWRRMYSAELLKKVGPMPEDTLFDDIAYLPVVHSYAQKPMSTTRIVYNYFRRSSSTVGGVSPEIIDSTVRSEKYAIEKCNPKYRDDVMLFVAKRIIGNMSSRWIYSDKLAVEISGFMPMFEKCSLIKNDTVLYDKLKAACRYEDEMIPKRVYLTNFDGKLTDEYIAMVKEKAFDNCEVVILDNSNCDVNENNNVASAAKDGNTEFVAKYFALKSVYENGGVYLDRRMIINKPLNYLRLDRAFFSFLDRNTYSEWIFGGVKGEKVLGDILATYTNNHYKNQHLSLARRIQNILTVLHSVPLTGMTYKNENNLSVYSPDVLVCNLHKDSEVATVVQMCSHMFDEAESDDNITVRYQTLSLLSDRTSSSSSSIVVKQHETEDYRVVAQEVKDLKYRLESIENSSAYRLALKLYEMGRGSRSLKAIVKKIMKV